MANKITTQPNLISKINSETHKCAISHNISKIHKSRFDPLTLFVEILSVFTTLVLCTFYLIDNLINLFILIYIHNALQRQGMAMSGVEMGTKVHLNYLIQLVLNLVLKWA